MRHRRNTTRRVVNAGRAKIEPTATLSRDPDGWYYPGDGYAYLDKRSAVKALKALNK